MGGPVYSALLAGLETPGGSGASMADAAKVPAQLSGSLLAFSFYQQQQQHEAVIEDFLAQCGSEPQLGLSQLTQDKPVDSALASQKPASLQLRSLQCGSTCYLEQQTPISGAPSALVQLHPCSVLLFDLPAVPPTPPFAGNASASGRSTTFSPAIGRAADYGMCMSRQQLNRQRQCK